MMSIGKVSERTGLAVSAIRYYEEEGLLQVGRNAGGQRRYRSSDIRRLSFIMIAQRLGFSISMICEQLKQLPDNRTPTKSDWSKLSETFRQHLDGRIAALENLRDKLDGCIGCGCLSLESCQLYNPNDSVSDKGPGPRFLLGDRPEGAK